MGLQASGWQDIMKRGGKAVTMAAAARGPDQSLGVGAGTAAWGYVQASSWAARHGISCRLCFPLNGHISSSSL